MELNGRIVSSSELVELVLGGERGPIYDPPYESPLEDAFAWQLVKYLGEDVALHKQVEVSTICGEFRIDFVAEIGSKRVGFECDGKDYHDIWRDECRDALILGTRGVDVIYHLPGAALTYHMHDCLWLAGQCDPELFHAAGRDALNGWASQDARRSAWRAERSLENLSITYRAARGLVTAQIFRRCATPLDPPPFWVSVWRFAQDVRAQSVDELAAAWFHNAR